MADPVTKPVPDARAARWDSEAAFFDAHAPAEEAPIDPVVAARYRRAARPWFNKEYRFRLLGDLAGKRVLDVGCGMGDNSILLALRGAQVTGIDVSPRSVEVARRRAHASGVPRPPRFVCAPVEVAELPARGFDVIWGDGILHHVIPELEGVLARLAKLARPGATFLFSEPVNRLPWLRRVREALPVHTEATPGERPLVEAELDAIRRFVPDLELRPFHLLGRVNRFILPGAYEHARPARRAAVSLVCAVDYALLSVPALAPAAGMAVIYGHYPR